MKRRHLRSRHHGFALLDALLAIVVLAFGALLLTRLAGDWQRSSDQARHDADALRLAAATIESARSRASLTRPDGGGVAQLADGSDRPTLGPSAPYERRWNVIVPDARAPLRALTVEVGSAMPVTPETPVRLQSAILGIDARDTAELLRRAPAPGEPWTPWRRHASIPAQAIVIAEGRSGRSAWPFLGGRLVLSHADGRVLARCDQAPATAHVGDLSNCRPLDALVLQGWIHAPAGLSLSLIAQSTDASTPRPECALEPMPREWQDASEPTAQDVQAWRYACLLPVAAGRDGAPGRWSGRVRAQAAGASRECAVPSPSADGATGPPGSYTALADSLAHENHWLLVAGDCPPGSAPIASD